MLIGWKYRRNGENLNLKHNAPVPLSPHYHVNLIGLSHRGRTFFFEGNLARPKVEFSKQIQFHENFEGLRENRFRISASPQISKEIHALPSNA